MLMTRTRTRTFQMYQLKDQRLTRQEYCRELGFTNIFIHGDVNVNDDLPSELKVSFVPASLQRMLDAWHGVRGGVTLAGIQIRDCDVCSSLPKHKVKDVRLLLTESKPHHIQIELQCFCQKSVCCFISSLELHNSWFQSIECNGFSSLDDW